MPSAFRIVKEQFKSDAFSGEGAYEFGGRWNSPGYRLVYASETLALACLEMLVHLDRSSLLRSYVFIEVSFSGSLVSEIEDVTELPPDWRSSLGSIELQTIGDNWIANGERGILKVPSAVIPRSYNYLINPEHEKFEDIALADPEPVGFDPRLK